MNCKGGWWTSNWLSRWRRAGKSSRAQVRWGLDKQSLPVASLHHPLLSLPAKAGNLKEIVQLLVWELPVFLSPGAVCKSIWTFAPGPTANWVQCKKCSQGHNLYRITEKNLVWKKFCSLKCTMCITHSCNVYFWQMCQQKRCVCKPEEGSFNISNVY